MNKDRLTGEKCVCFLCYEHLGRGWNKDQKDLKKSVVTRDLVENRRPGERGISWLDMAVHTCNPSAQEVEVEGSRVQGQHDKVQEIHKSMKVIS